MTIEEKLRQAERLSAIGEMSAGLAHESRNALQRSKACLELLALEVQERPRAMEFITRVKKAQDDLHHLYEKVCRYAAPILLQRERCHLGEVVQEVWHQLLLLQQGRTIDFQECHDGLDLSCIVDRFAIQQVFRNILENALSACFDPVAIAVQWLDGELAGRPALQVSIRDNGPGLTAEQRHKIFEPFYTTKTTGTGLGMAIAKRIVEAHGGQIAVGNQHLGGAEILVILPREEP